MSLFDTGPRRDGSDYHSRIDFKSYLQVCSNAVDYYRAYILWMMELTNSPSKYRELFTELNSIPFEWNENTKELSMDSNRSNDGLTLRSEFFDEYIPNYPNNLKIDCNILLGDSCTVLEMMVALVRRMEHHVSERSMDVIFWEILENLGIDGFDNDTMMRTDAVDELHERIENMEMRRYGKTGKGSMFPVNRRGFELNKMEIWRQANLYSRIREGDFE